MGFLTEGDTLAWHESLPFLQYVKEHGILQFLNTLHATQQRTGDCLKWGDEIEYMLLRFNDDTRTVRLGLRGADILDELMHEELAAISEAVKSNTSSTDALSLIKTLWRPEYARFMIEGTPGQPYGDCVTEFRKVELNMRLRRERVQSLLHPDERIVSFSNFPLLGTLRTPFTEPPNAPNGPVAQSRFTPDELIFPHRRFATLTQNIRERKGKKVAIKVPVYHDTHTQPVDNGQPLDNEKERVDVASDEIYMDSMAFGMGMHCLQCTFQCVDINESRMLYDQLAVMAPIMLALTAATPIFRGYLSDTDVRWFVLCASVDDRTDAEQGLAPHPTPTITPTTTTATTTTYTSTTTTPITTHTKYVINKSRYSSIDAYIAPSAPDYGFKDAYNDIALVYDHDICAQLESAGVDIRLARHVAHLFIRDPLVIYNNKIEEVDDAKQMDHWENIQSTNWRTVRFKPPPSTSSGIGWRTEFRPMEIQMTDFENAALAVFMILLTRAIRSFGVNLYLPLSYVDLNMQRAARRDAVNTQQFFFRRHLSVHHPTRDSAESVVGLPPHLTFNNNTTTTTDNNNSNTNSTPESVADEFGEMSLGDIMNGSATFKGLIPLVEEYVQSINIDVETGIVVARYLTLLRKRASGELLTNASWIREFVTKHPAYKQDSVVSDEIAYDLMKTAVDIGEGRVVPAALLGDLCTPGVWTDIAPPPPCGSVA
eukprot:TRINITY_DN1846_c0_g2_i1.p1 TRINITY_DN1846_c0_g2~~TRINITY_DN1846_c0_g2_i1.p1  ORF type:complete len:711 (-),score=139.88 TRINITY_DN1846_c0_g2_i1:65-2197(-)